MNCLESSVYVSPKGLPIQEVREITVTRPAVGQRFGMRIEKLEKGTFLTTVLPGSVASQAGLKIGDEILQLNGVSVQPISINTINQLIRSTQYHLKIAYRPRTMLAKIRFIVVKKIDGRVGIRLKRIAQGLFVDVVLPNSAASDAGIKEGDELISVNNQNVTSWSQEDASKLLRELPDDDFVVLHLREILPPFALYDIMHKKGQISIPPLKESLSVTYCHPLQSNLLLAEPKGDENTKNNLIKKSLSPTNQDVISRTAYSPSSNSNSNKIPFEFPVYDHGKMSFEPTNISGQTEPIAMPTHTRILNSFSDYSLGCSKSLTSEEQIQ
ncbi:unnamed protein product [Heterobilharzia americana]|nr:unnamed protein product [Heterobilharzia americana]